MGEAQLQHPMVHFGTAVEVSPMPRFGRMTQWVAEQAAAPMNRKCDADVRLGILVSSYARQERSRQASTPFALSAAAQRRSRRAARLAQRGREAYGKESLLPPDAAVLAKLTSKNQLTLPRAAVEAAGSPEYFEIAVRAGQLLLTPVRIQRADAVRARLAQLDLGDDDLGGAVGWARQAASAPKAAPARVAEPRPAYARSTTKKPAPARKPRRR